MPNILGLQELLKTHRLVQFGQDILLGFRCVIRVIVILIEFFLPPGDLLRLADEHVFDSYGITIDSFEMPNDDLQAARLQAKNATSIEYPIEILLTQAKISRSSVGR